MPQTATPSPLLLTVVEVGHLIGQSRASVYKLIRAGRLPTVKIGGSTRVPRAGVEQLVAELIAEGASTDGSPAVHQTTRLPANSAGLGRDAEQV
jgi:excisionase family DNA binding protein